MDEDDDEMPVDLQWKLRCGCGKTRHCDEYIVSTKYTGSKRVFLLNLTHLARMVTGWSTIILYTDNTEERVVANWSPIREIEYLFK